MGELLESGEAARRLGIKLSSLYSYVSRGLLPSYRTTDGRRRLFDEDDVVRLLQRAHASAGRTSPFAITTAISTVTEQGPVYRGIPAVDLATTSSFEKVAHLLWGTESSDEFEPLVFEPPKNLHRHDLIRWALVMTSAADQLRSDLRPEAVVRAAHRLVATMIDVLPPAGPEQAGRPSLARRLATSLAPAVSEDLVNAVNAAMVLVSNHGLTDSTVAVRVAASSRVTYYDAILAGLGTSAGPATESAYNLLVAADQDGAEHALDRTVRQWGKLPGFGHPMYPHGDPRTPVMFNHFKRLSTKRQQRVVRELVAAAERHGFSTPNIDLPIAAIMWSTDMRRSAGSALFTIARVVGWTAHFIEELGEPPSRLRTRSALREPRRGRL